MTVILIFDKKIVRNCKPYYDGLFGYNDLVSKAYVDTEIGKLPKPDLHVLKLDGSKSMAGNLNMNGHTIFGIRSSSKDNAALTVGGAKATYLPLLGDRSMQDNLNMGNHAIIGIRSASQDNAALTVGGAKATYLPLLGDRSMQDNLNMGGHAIINIKPFVEDDSSQAASDAQKNEVMNFGYFHTQRGELKRLINDVSSEALNRKNRDPMEDNVDMANHSIVNLKEPENHQATYAANVKFVANEIVDNNTILQTQIDSKIEASEEALMKTVQQENVFEKVMVDDLFKLDDSDIHKVGVVDKDFHKVNQQTYLFKIDYDSEIGYYSTRLSVNVVYLPKGYYTMVFEMYFANKIDVDEITINAESGTLSVSKINTKKSSDHTRSIVNFYKAIINPSIDDLDIDIA